MKRIVSALFVVVLSFHLNLSAQDSSGAVLLTVDECVRIASTGSVNVKNSHLDYMSAKMFKQEVFINYLPTVSLVGAGFVAVNPLVRIGVSDFLGTSDMANNIKYYGGTSAQMYGVKTTYEALNNAYGAALTLSQPVFAGGRIVNGNRLASLGVDAASLKESIAKRDASTDIEQKYWLAVSLEEKMKVVEEGLAFAESMYKDVVSAYQSGLVTEYEKHQVEIARQDLKSKRIKLKGGIMLARMDLCNAIGMDISKARYVDLADRLEAAAPPDTYYMDPSGIASSLEETQLLELAVKQKELEKSMALGEVLPQVGVGASYSYGHLIGTPQNNGTFYAIVKVPITDWAKATSKMKNIDYQKEKATNQREYLGSMLELQLRKFWVEVESTWEELQLKEEQVSQAHNVYDDLTDSFYAGIVTRSALLEKRVDYDNAECERIDARIAYRNAVAAFQARCGK